MTTLRTGRSLRSGEWGVWARCGHQRHRSILWLGSARVEVDGPNRTLALLFDAAMLLSKSRHWPKSAAFQRVGWLHRGQSGHCL